MNKFSQHTGTVLPLNIANIDTDNIIPKQFLKNISRINLKDCLFFNWRFLDENNKKLNLNFILNQPKYKNSTILLTQKNFGCGSSREHAVWALIDYGFRAIIAPNFSAIFYKNSINNRLLLITLSEKIINHLFEVILIKNPGIQMNINLIRQNIYINSQTYYFKINNSYRYSLINNLDDINLTLMHKKSIRQYEETQPLYLK